MRAADPPYPGARTGTAWRSDRPAPRFPVTPSAFAIADDIAVRLNPTDADAARTDALALFGMLIGTLQLARALTDRDLSDQLLARGQETALKLLDDRAS